MNFNVVLLVVFTVATVNFHGAYSRRDACQYEREDFPAQKPVVIPPPIVGVDDIPISALNDATKTPKLGSTRYHSQDDKRYCSSSYYDPVRGYLPEIRTDYHQRDNTGAPQLPTTRRPKKIPQKKRKPSRTFPKPSLKDKFLKKLCSFKFVRFDNDTIEEYKEGDFFIDEVFKTQLKLFYFNSQKTVNWIRVSSSSLKTTFHFHLMSMEKQATFL